MQNDLNRLADALRRHTERHETLLALAEEKRDCIIRNDTARIDAILAEEITIVEEVRVIEAERIACVGALGRQLELGETPDLDSILAAVPDAAAPVVPIRQRLRSVLERLRERTRRNEDLLRASLRHIEQFFAVLAEARTTAPTYTRGGGRSGGQVRLVDQTA